MSDDQFVTWAIGQNDTVMGVPNIMMGPGCDVISDAVNLRPSMGQCYMENACTMACREEVTDVRLWWQD